MAQYEIPSHPIVQFDVAADLVTLARRDKRYDAMIDSAAFMEALIQEAEAANLTIGSYRVIIEAVPINETPIFDPLDKDE